ncbi:MAG: hypothetical protein U0230_08700 [Polyangiales bacterium]
MPRPSSATERRAVGLSGPALAALAAFLAFGPPLALPASTRAADGDADAATVALRLDGERLDESVGIDLVADGALTDTSRRALVVTSDRGLVLSLEGPLRLRRNGRMLAGPVRVGPGDEGHFELEAGDGPASAALVLDEGGSVRRVPVRVHRIELVDGEGRTLEPALGSARLSTRSPDLALADRDAARGADPDDLLVRVASPVSPRRPASEGEPARAEAWPLELGTRGRLASDTPPLALPLDPEAPGVARTPWVRLYADALDVALPARSNRLLRASLGDVLEARWRTPSGVLVRALGVGRAGSDTGDDALRTASLRFVVLRSRPGGPPALGRDEREARALVGAQLELARAIFAPCAVGFGPEAAPVIRFLAPPPPYALVVGEEDGFPARGGGLVRFRANGRTVGPIETVAGDPPLATAERIVTALRAAGFSASASEVPRTSNGAGHAADVLVRDARGEPAFLEPDGSAPIATDAVQRVRRVDPSPFPGLRAFRNADAVAGTAEERALVRALADSDPRTIDVLFVPGFDRTERLGEAFLPGDAGPLAGTIVIARAGVARMATAYTLAHELAHVLLDEPHHLDEVGAPDPTRLLGGGAPRGDLRGPRRLSREECRMMRTNASSAGSHLLRAP